MIMMDAQMMDAIAIISEIRVSGVLHLAFDNLSIELTRDPIKLTATKNTKLEIYIPQDV
jgi:hypothetical protein